MTQPLLAPLPRDHSDSAPSGFLVLRQNPETREYIRVGTLHRTSDRYIFEYSERARRDSDLTPLPGFRTPPARTPPPSCSPRSPTG